MKKVFFALVALMGLMCHQAQAQSVGCDDTVHWGTPLSFEANKCCWTVLEGPTDCFYASTNQIDCNYDTLADHRFLSPWVEIPSFAATDSLVLIYATQVSCTADYSVAITTDGVNYDTLRRRMVDNYEHDTILLGAYAGQVVRIEFCHYGLNSRFYPYAGDCSYAADYHWQLLFQSMQWRSLVYPVATWWVPTKAYVGETTWLRASLTNGSHTGLTYTWHSSLTGQTLTGDSVGLAYTAAGLDTLTLVVSNAFGSDTLTQTVTVVDCGDVITAHPWKVDFVNEYDCWRTVGTVGWSYASRNISGNTYYGISALHNSGGANIISSPAVVLPTDSTGLRLYWKDCRLGSGTSTYYVLVSTTSRFDIAEYDTIFTCTSQTSNLTQRSVSLANYAGDTVYIAFCKMLQNGRQVFFTDVQMYNALAPIGVIDAPNYVLVGEAANYTVTLSQGDTLGLTVTLHSALKDSSWAMNADGSGNGSWGLDLVYDTPGEETVTVTASNAQGTLMLNANLGVFVCNTVSTFPWEEDFSNAAGSYNACWTINGYSHKNSNYSSYDEETGEYWTLTNYMRPSAAGNYMITPPIAIPANETNMTFMVEYVRGALDIRVSPTASTDTALFTDLLFTEPTSNYIKRRWINLGAYAGQTIRVALVTTNPNNQCINRVWVGVDTLPYIGTKVSMPAKIHCDSTALCTVALFRGSTDGLHYSWTSAVGGIFTTNALGDSAWVNYGAGFSSTEDTITVITTNAYGADTVTKPLHIIDCTPALTLPWRETFDDGLACWYKPEGSNFGYWNNNCMHSYCNSDTIDSWIMSKAVAIPADTNKEVILEWTAASSDNTFVHTYYVLATTSANYTDTANYIPLYYDSSAHPTYSTFDKRSVSLRQFAGQTIHVAFRNRPVNATGSNYRLIIDDVAIRSAQLPVVSLSAPTTVNSHEDVTYTATYVEGSTNGLSLTWHSALLDSTWTGLLPSAANWALVYPVGGYDTITVIATNIYGADSTTRVVMVNSCLIDNLPYEETFIGVTATTYNHSSGGKVPNCWHRYWAGNTNYMPHVINSYLSSTAINTYVQSNPAFLLMAGSGSGFDSVATVESPIFDAPLNEQLLSFYYMYEGANHGQLSVGYMQNGAFVEVKSMERQVTGRTDTVSLSAFPADVHRFALRWVRSDVWYGVIVDNIRVFAPDTLPHVHLTVPMFITYVGDTTTYNAYLTDGMAEGLTYTWHSTLLGTTVVAGSQWSVVYNTSGYDTVTVIATNAYGSDTAWGVHYVDTYPLPQVTIVGPASMTLQGSIDSRTANFIPTLNNCSPNGLTYMWHSTLLNQWSTTSGQWSVVYNTGGIDTVTLIVSNVDGADTATKIVNIYDCRGLAAPYFEDFESVTPEYWSSAYGNLPDCWGNIAIGASHRPKVVSSYLYISNLPDQALLIMAGNGSGYADAAYALLPIFSDSLQQLSVAFDYRCESASYGNLTVGYWNDSLLTFHPVQNLASHTGNYLRDTVSFAAVTASDNHTHIALKWYCSGSFYGVVIDNIEVFRDNGILAPEMLTVENVTAYCATLRWSEVDTATAYRVTLGGAMSLDTVVTDTTITLCNLEEDADYNVMVVPLVGSETGRAASTAFHTRMLCAPLANVSISPDGIISWQYDTIGEETPTGVIIEITETASGAPVSVDTAYTSPYFPASTMPGRTYTFAIRTLCGSITSNTVIETTITRAMPVPNTCAEVASTTTVTNNRFLDNLIHRKNYSQILYPADFAASTDTLYGISLRVAQIIQHYSNAAQCYYDIYIGQTLASTISAPVTADSLTMVAENTYISMPQNYTGWKDIVFDIPYVIDATRNLIVTIVEHSYPSCIPLYGVHTDSNCVHFVQTADHQSDYTNPYTLNFNWEVNTYIPDIRLLGGCASNVCIAPDVTVTAQDTHNVSLSWQQLGAESMWLVEYRTMTDSLWTAFGTVSTPSCTVTGLHPSTIYELRVASLCADTLYSEPDTVLTTCGLLEPPYTINFLFDGEVPCWTLSSGVSHYYWRGLVFYHFDDRPERYIVTPQVAVDIRNLRAVITAKNGGVSHLIDSYAVGICNSSDGNGAVWIDTVEVGSTSQQNEIYFNLYNPPAGESATGRYVILQSVAGDVAIEEFTLEVFTDCVPVRSITASQITENTAMLQWEGNNASHSFAVYLDNSLIATQTNNTISLTSLTPNTEYTAAVRKICGTGDTAAAVTITFRTTCTHIGLPYFDNFDYDTVNELVSECWTFHLSTDRARIQLVNVGNVKALSLYDYEGDRPNYICSPRLMVGTTGAVVRFKGQTTFNSSIEAGVMIDVDDTSTFIPLTTVAVNNGGMAWYEFSTDSVAACAAAGTYTIAFRWEYNDEALIDSLSVTAVPVTTLTITLAVNDTTMGTVSGAGTYNAGSTVTITATPNEGYRFVTWSDSVTSPTRVFVVTSDLSLTAYFAPSGVGIDGTEGSAQNVAIHPNPTTGDAHISVSMPSVVTVTDLQGRTVIQPTQVDSTLRIAEGTLPKGIYFVSVGNSAGTVVKKLVIQ